MKQNFKLGGSLVAALVLGTVLSGAVSAQTLTMGLRAGPDSIDPHWSTLGSQAEALRHIFDTLVMSDENLRTEARSRHVLEADRRHDLGVQDP